jgi:putative DNA primase/helicase
MAHVETTKDDEESSQLDEAKDFLSDLLSGGPKPGREVKSAALGEGHAWRTIRRAQSKLKIKPKKTAWRAAGFGGFPKVAKETRRCPRILAS